MNQPAANQPAANQPAANQLVAARLVLGLLLLWMAQPGRCLAQDAAPYRRLIGLSPELAARVEAAVEGQRQADGAVGVAVGVITEGRVAYLGGFGFADLESQTPIDANSLFRWASVSKLLTAVAAMQLSEAGELDLDADVRKYVPEFPEKDHMVTARRLLCHQSGVVHYFNGKVVRTQRDYEVEHPFVDVVTALDTFKESPLLFPPGTRYSYSTHAYILLSAVVQRAGDQSFQQQIRDRIIKPLGMKTLQPDYQWREIPGRVSGYRKYFTKVIHSEDSDVSWKLGGGGYLSNIEDMALLAEGLINRRLVSESTEALMWTRQPTNQGGPTAYGLGFHLAGEGADFEVSHGGSQSKTRTRLHTYPRRKLGFVFATNSEWVQPINYINAMREALASSEEPPQP